MLLCYVSVLWAGIPECGMQCCRLSPSLLQSQRNAGQRIEQLISWSIPRAHNISGVISNAQQIIRHALHTFVSALHSCLDPSQQAKRTQCKTNARSLTNTRQKPWTSSINALARLHRPIVKLPNRSSAMRTWIAWRPLECAAHPTFLGPKVRRRI